MQKLSDKEKENALNEVRILASIRHPNIIAYKEAFIDDASQSLCIVMEYADSGDLFQQICEHQKNNTLFKEEDIWRIFIQMVRGLRCLHEILIFHRDLKSANVFLNKDGTAKLGDMNVSKVAKKGMLYTQTGTPYYASPEVWRDQPYDNKSDIWSLGCVLYESITLKPPFRADDMQGLYKKVLRGVYPKIPNIYSTDLANLVKALIQVTPQMRPSCDRILEMPIVRKRIEKLFPQDEFYDSQSSLLNTIRVPKNLLYLTDRLPKPSYESPNHKKKMEEEERIRRKTHDAGNMLPEISKTNTRKSKGGESQSQQPQMSSQQPQNQISTQATGGGKRSRRQNRKSVRVKSDLREGSQMQEGYTAEDSTVKIGTASQVDEDRRSVVSKGSVAQLQQQPTSGAAAKDPVIRKNSTKTRVNQQPAVSMSHRTREQNTQDRERVNEEYEDDQFERDDQPARSPPKTQINGHIEDRDSSYGQHELSSSSPPQHQISASPHTKRSNASKAVSQINQQQMPSPQMMLMSNRPQVNYSVNSGQANIGGPQSVERIYLQKVPAPLPALVEGAPNQQSRKNLAYINISSEGAKPVGYLRKAEQDLIKRRYKYNHASDHIQRVALIYGNGGGSIGPGVTGSQYHYGYGSGGSGNSVSPNPLLSNNIYSPYLANQMAINNSGQSNSLSGIVKRNKYLPQQIIEENNSGSMVGGRGAIRLPNLNNMNRQQLDHNNMNQQSQAHLPPLTTNSNGNGVSSSIPSVNGQGILSKAQMQLYQPYMIKPKPLKSIPKPLLVPSQGISGEKININKYGSGQSQNSHISGIGVLNGGSALHDLQLPQPVGIVSRSHQHQLASLSANSQGQSQQQPQQHIQSNTTASQETKDIKKIYKKKSKPIPSVAAANNLPAASQPTRNATGVGLGADTNGGDTQIGVDQGAFE